MKWLNIIKIIVECVIPILGHWGKRKAVKDLHTVTDGIERFSRATEPEEKGAAIKKFIKEAAEASGVEKRLNKRIKKWEESLWTKIF